MADEMKAMIVTEENQKAVKEILATKTIPLRWIEESNWIIWGTYHMARILPHAVFSKLYTVVETRGDIKIIEKI